MSVFVETYLFIFRPRVHSGLEEQQSHHKERVEGEVKAPRSSLEGVGDLMLPCQTDTALSSPLESELTAE